MENWGHMLLKFLDLDPIYCPNFQCVLLNFGTFRGIFVPPAQLLRPVASEQLLHLCHFDELKYFP